MNTEMFDESFRGEESAVNVVRLPVVRRDYSRCEDQPRFEVVNFGPGGIVPCFSLREAMLIAKQSKASISS